MSIADAFECLACFDTGFHAGPQPDDDAEPCGFCPAGERLEQRWSGFLAPDTERTPASAPAHEDRGAA